MLMYEDATSQSTYWLVEWELLDKSSEIADVTTQNEFWNNYISENKDPKREISVEVNKEFNYFYINPWDTVKIRNINYTFDNIQVKSVRFNSEKMTLSLEKFESLADMIIRS